MQKFRQTANAVPITDRLDDGHSNIITYGAIALFLGAFWGTVALILF